MVAATRFVEVSTSLLHVGSLSIAVARVAEHNFVGALAAIVVGCLSVFILTVVVIVCELARWYVPRYLATRTNRS